MRVDVVTPPALPAVSVDELRVHARLDDTGDDVDLITKIEAAIQYVEQATGRALITRTVRETSDGWPESGKQLLAVAPVQAVASVTVNGTVLTTSAYTQVGDNLIISGGATGSVVVTYTAGYGSTPASVPADLRQAVLMVAAHWLRTREGVTVEGDQVLTELPHSVTAVLGRRGRFFL